MNGFIYSNIFNTYYSFFLETLAFQNEHPVTIYPGLPSPQKRMPPRTLPGSIERHREVCRKSELSSPSSELRSPTGSNCSNGFILLNDEFIKRPRSPVGNGFILQNDEFIKRPKSPLNLPATPFGIKISIAAMDNIMNNRNKHKINNELKMNLQNKRHSQLSDMKAANSDEDRFSDDSLEETSLPPPPAPAPVPPPPSLSCPVTPSKRHSIAWEVNLDDLTTNGNGVISTKVSLPLANLHYYYKHKINLQLNFYVE